MSLLTDWLVDLLGDIADVPSERGLVVLCTAASVIFAGVTVWLLIRFPDPIWEPEWGLGVLVGSMAFGGGGVLVSLLSVQARDAHRGPLVLGAIANAVAAAIPIVWISVR